MKEKLKIFINYFKLLRAYNSLVIKYNALVKKTQSELYNKFINENCEYYLSYTRIKKELDDIKKNNFRKRTK